jgi:small-conductance mechanosensitive channel
MRFPVKWFRILRLPAILAGLGLAALHAGLAEEKSANAGFSSSEAIAERLEAVRRELAVPPGSAEPALRERLDRLEALIEYHRSMRELLATAEDQLAKVKQESTAWSGFPQPPPFSILLLDEVRDSLATARNEQDISRTQIGMLNAELEAARDSLDGHQQAERRLLELAERESDPTAAANARRQARVENIEGRIVAEKIGRGQLALSIMQARIATAAARIELAGRQLKLIGDRTVFTQHELDGLLQQTEREREETARKLMGESRDQQAPDSLLIWKVQFLDLAKAFWNARFTAINSDDPAKAREARETIKSLRERIDNWVKISELRLAGGDPAAADLDPAQLRDILQQVRAMQRRIGFAIDDLDGWSLRKRGAPVLDKIGGTLAAIWDAELYLVEETQIIDGKKIPIYRPITVGKLLRLAIILTIGWFLLRFISRRIRQVVAHRWNIPETTADLAGKWAFALGLFGLVLYGLHTVSIPLTAFAFLGGALAIGVGFGTQTLLKNFISGIILLFERPLKVGDVVEVENITGTIKQIGIRASVIQHFDGIETLVPNSTLLENQLTNWTFSSSVIRHELAVGVAYGSPTREVSKLLLAVADNHGLVLKDPVPEVRFEDFGPDSLVFSLLFWLDSRKTGRRELASDLRFMIDKAFTDAGIVIAFPQRDIHFDAAKPLRIELARQTKSLPTKS